MTTGHGFGSSRPTSDMPPKIEACHPGVNPSSRRFISPVGQGPDLLFPLVCSMFRYVEFMA